MTRSGLSSHSVGWSLSCRWRSTLQFDFPVGLNDACAPPPFARGGRQVQPRSSGPGPCAATGRLRSQSTITTFSPATAAARARDRATLMRPSCSSADVTSTNPSLEPRYIEKLKVEVEAANRARISSEAGPRQDLIRQASLCRRASRLVTSGIEARSRHPGAGVRARLRCELGGNRRLAG